jgi:uncharacterized membrane protein
MNNSKTTEHKRRSVVKSLVWRFIGIIWTWTGAYLIILLVPEQFKTAAWLATFIVIYHHSTRMIMYYFYERIWSCVSWGRIGSDEDCSSMSLREKIIWTTTTVAAIILIFFLLIYITPMIKSH